MDSRHSCLKPAWNVRPLFSPSRHKQNLKPPGTRFVALAELGECLPRADVGPTGVERTHDRIGGRSITARPFVAVRTLPRDEPWAIPRPTSPTICPPGQTIRPLERIAHGGEQRIHLVTVHLLPMDRGISDPDRLHP